MVREIEQIGDSFVEFGTQDLPCKYKGIAVDCHIFDEEKVTHMMTDAGTQQKAGTIQFNHEITFKVNLKWMQAKYAIYEKEDGTLAAAIEPIE